MPAVIPIVAAVATAAVGAAGTAGVISLTTAALISLAITVVATAATFILQKRAQNRLRQQGDQGNRSGQQTLRIGDAARRVVVGTGRLAASAHPVYDADDANSFHRLLVFAHGKTNGFREFQALGETLSLNSSGTVINSASGKWDGRIRIQTTDGSDEQAALPSLISEYQPWSADHRGRGLAMAYVRQRPVAFDHPDAIENNRELEIHAIMDGSDEIYDPRDGSTGWTDNAALIFRWYLMHPDGFRLPATRIDDDAFTIAADLCDVEIPLAAGGTEKQFRCAGVFTLAEDRNSIAGAMLANMDGFLVTNSKGQIGVRIGNAQVSNLLTFNQNQIQIERFQSGRVLRDFRNSVQAVIASEDHNYQQITVPPQEDDASVAAIGRRTFPMELRFCPSATQAQRLARRKLIRMNAQDVGEVVTDLSGINAKPGSTIYLGYEGASTDLPLRTATREYIVKDNIVRMQVQSIDPLEEYWDPSFEKTVQPNPPQGSNGRLIGAPDSVAMSGQIQIINSNEVALLAVVTWPTLNDSTVLAEVEIAETPADGEDPVWFGNTTVNSSQAKVLIPGVSDGLSYDARVRFRGASGQYTDFTTITGVVLSLADAKLPAPVVTVSETTIQEGEDVTISVTAFNTYLVDQVRIFEGGAQIHAEAVSPGQTVDHLRSYPEPTTGQFVITAAIVNDSGVQGLISTPITITVTAAGSGEVGDGGDDGGGSSGDGGGSPDNGGGSDNSGPN